LDDRAVSLTKPLRLGLVVACAALVPSTFVLIAGQNPWHVLVTLLVYAFGQGWSEVLVHAIPLTLIGLGVAIALRAGLFNIGSDGQFIAGALLAVAIAPWLDGWGFAGLVIFLALGFAGGSAFGGIAGWLRARFDASEIIVTIMLNYVALQTASYLVRGPMQEPMHIFPRSELIPDDLILPIILEGTRLHAGLIVALLALVVGAVLLKKTVFGFQVSVLGANAGAAAYAGYRRNGLIILTMALSGGLAGLAGAIEVGGVYHRFEDSMGEGFGLSGIAVALIARLEPAAIPLAAILFGVFFAGAGALQRELALPFPLVWIIEATAIFTVTALQWALRSQKAVS
jgi:ABC-type uncharacterized transport system permease subunit